MLTSPSLFLFAFFLSRSRPLLVHGVSHRLIFIGGRYYTAGGNGTFGWYLAPSQLPFPLLKSKNLTPKVVLNHLAILLRGF
jgi:hypothetical protein